MTVEANDLPTLFEEIANLLADIVLALDRIEAARAATAAGDGWIAPAWRNQLTGVRSTQIH